MNAQCFMDLFDASAFRGERRRIFGPVRLEARVLGLDPQISVRVGSHAAVRLELEGGERKTLSSGEQVDVLSTDGIQWIEVRQSDA